MLNSSIINSPTKHFHSYVERNANYAGKKENIAIIICTVSNAAIKQSRSEQQSNGLLYAHTDFASQRVMHRVIVNLAFVERHKKILAGKNFLFPFTYSTPLVMVTQARQHREFPSRILAIMHRVSDAYLRSGYSLRIKEDTEIIRTFHLLVILSIWSYFKFKVVWRLNLLNAIYSNCTCIRKRE